MKYILFGAGDIGIRAYKILGERNVECFADNFKCGAEMYGKKILSFEEMLQKSDDCQVIITSDDYADILEKQLQDAGMYKYLIFNRRCTNQMKEFLPKYNYLYNTKYMDYTDILLNYQINSYKQIAIYGINKYLGNLLLELAIQSALEYVVAIIEPDTNLKYIHGIPIRDLEDIRDDIDCLIINKKRTESRIRDELGKFSFSIVDIYNVDKFIFYNRHPELKRFHNIHKGKRAFILGNGPSVRLEDIERLRQNNEICFGLNKIHKIYEKTDWRPDYICMSDTRVISACENELNDITEDSVVFMADRFFYSDKVQYIHLKSEYYEPNFPGFSEDITEGVCWGYTVTYDLALQIAAYMGFSEIYLLGIDHNNVGPVTDSRNHFIPNYFSEKEDGIYKDVIANFKAMDLAYQKADLYSREHGFRIYNATRGGKLEIFERVDFDKLF